jgi:outer membrane protein assembly factor BamB
MAWRGFPGFARNGGFLDLSAHDRGVVVMDSQNTVSMLDPDSGKTLWITQLGTRQTRFLGATIANDQVLCASDIELYVLDISTGDLMDRQSLASVVQTRPVVVDQVAVFGSTGGEVIGHSLYSGFKLWGYQLDGEIAAAPVVIGDSIGVVSQGGDVIMLDSADGVSRGRARVFGGVEGRLSTDGGALYVASRDQSVYAFDGRNGDRLWRHRSEAPLASTPTYFDGLVFVDLPSEGMSAFDAGTGEVLWQNSGLRGEVVAMRGDTILVWSGTTLWTADVDDGEVLSEASVPQALRVITSDDVDGDVYVLERGGSVARFSSR